MLSLILADTSSFHSYKALLHSYIFKVFFKIICQISGTFWFSTGSAFSAVLSWRKPGELKRAVLYSYDEKHH